MTSHVHSINFSEHRVAFLFALGVNFIWINLSEVFRYFVFVMPMMREAFPSISDIAPMNMPVFMIWGFWDSILVLAATIIPWLVLSVFGGSCKMALLAGTGVWTCVFVIFWLALFNMNLATGEIVLFALPLAWFEMIIAALVVWYFCFHRKKLR